MEGMLWFPLPWWNWLENAVISSITVGLVTGRVVDATPLHLCSISPKNFGRNLRSLISLGEDAHPPVAGYKNRHSVGIKDALDMQSSSGT